MQSTNIHKIHNHHITLTLQEYLLSEGPRYRIIDLNGPRVLNTALVQGHSYVQVP